MKHLMKKMSITLFFTFFCLTSINAQVSFGDYNSDGTYVFDDTLKLIKDSVFTTYKSEFGLGSDDEMVLIDEAEVIADSTDTIRRPCTYSRYQQYYKGYEVEGKSMSIRSKCEVVTIITGSVLTSLNISDASLISESSALTEALDELGDITYYAWEDSVLEAYEQEALEDSTASYYPTGILKIVKKRGDTYEHDITDNYELCWEFDITYFDTVTIDTLLDTVMLNKRVHVNANTGDIYNIYDPLKFGSTHSADQWTWYYGQRFDEMFTYKKTLGTSYRLEDRVFRIYSERANTGIFQSKAIKDNDNNWIETDTKTAAQAHWAVTGVKLYYLSLGRNTNKQIRIYNDSYISFNPAGYKWSKDVDRIYVAKDNGSVYHSAFDILGHEYTHAIIRRSSQLGINNSGEPAALEEGFCDIFGWLSEYRILGRWDWSIGEELGSPYTRVFNNPNADDIPSPNYYQGAFWLNSGKVGRGGPLRKWFNHVSQGEAHWPTPYGGIGIDKTELFVRDIMLWYVNANSTYEDVRRESMILAEKRWGKCSKEWNAVEQAWYDVGVEDQLSNCQLAFTPISPEVIYNGDVGGTAFNFMIIIPISDNEEMTVVDYTWTIPSNWTVQYNSDNSGFWVTDVDDDYSSQMVSVDIDYTEYTGGTVLTETHEFPIHFSDACSYGSSKPGKNATVNIENRVLSTAFDIKVYPNPTLNAFWVEDIPNETIIELYDMAGHKIYSKLADQDLERVNISNVPAGVYILNLTDNQGNRDVRKIIKQ